MLNNVMVAYKNATKYFVLSGIILSVTTKAEKRLEREKKEREAVEEELGKYREFCARQVEEITRSVNL